MKRSWCLRVIGVLALSSGCVGRPLGPTAPTSAAPRTIRVGVVTGSRTTVQMVSFERYVAGAALSEFAPADAPGAIVERMYEVQAVIGRTFAIAQLGRHAHEGFDLCSTTHCQLFEPSRLRTSKWAPAANSAALRTRGTILRFGGQPAAVLFHADCGGHTSAASSVWGGPDRPYLVARPDTGVAAAAHSVWRYEAASEAVMRALNADARTRVGARLDALSVLDRDAAGRATRIAIRGEQALEVRGEHLREVLSRAFGARSIKSTWFDVRHDRATFVFEGRGFGHGVGLCQAGALARLRGGSQTDAVLELYYPGTRLSILR